MWTSNFFIPTISGRTLMAGGISASTEKKTRVEAFIPLHPIAEQILSLYNTTDDEKPVFPLPNRDALWFEVHELGITIGKEENLSYHQSRHSFGTFLISADIPIESIAKMMGHSNIRTTQGYARITDDKISKDMDKLMERQKIQLPAKSQTTISKQYQFSTLWTEV